MSIAINAKQCVGCGKCSMVCPGSLIHMNADGKAFIKYPKDCWGCTSCLKECAVHAIRLPGLVLVGVLFGDAVGGGEVAHVDRHGQIAGGHTLLILVDDDGGLAGIDIVIGRNDRQLQLLVEELHGDEVAPGVAHSLKENGRLAVRVDVTVFGHPNVGIQTADGDLGGVGIGVVNGDAALGRAVVLLRNE